MNQDNGQLLWLNSHAQNLGPRFDPTLVQAFHKKLPGYASTRLVPLSGLARELNVKQVFLKDESRRLGLPAFKVMGASWGAFRAITAKLGISPDVSLETVGEEARKHSVTLFTATEGNHGRAVAYIARLLKIKAVVYVPAYMHADTRRALHDEGATLVVSDDYDKAVIESAQAGDAFAGGIVVQDTGFEGYEEIPTWIVEGYSTIVNEVDTELATLSETIDLAITPVGVGSLAHAIVRHYKAQGCRSKVVAVEPEAAACLNTSLKAGKPVVTQISDTIMAGMHCATVSSTAWKDLNSSIDGSIMITDVEAHQAVQYLKSQGVSAGPCGASGVAALRRIATLHRDRMGLGENSVILLLNTEGSRSYETPFSVSS